MEQLRLKLKAEWSQPSVCQLPTLVLQCYYLRVFAGFLPGIVAAAPAGLSKVQKAIAQHSVQRFCHSS